MDDRLELCRGGKAPADRPRGQWRHRVGDRRGDRAHRDGFDERGRMLASGVEYDAARSIGEIDTNLFEQRGGRRERRISDRQDIVAYGRMKGPWPWRAALQDRKSTRLNSSH